MHICMAAVCRNALVAWPYVGMHWPRGRMWECICRTAGGPERAAAQDAALAGECARAGTAEAEAASLRAQVCVWGSVM